MSSLLFEHLSKSWFEVLGFAIAGLFFYLVYLKRSKEAEEYSQTEEYLQSLKEKE